MPINFKAMLINNRITLSYQDFYSHVEKLVNKEIEFQGKNKKKLFEFIRINFQRLGRVYKTLTIKDKLSKAIDNIENTQHWIVITEAWCGDSAQTLPIIAKIANESNGKIDLDIVFRDDNLDIMEKYLTNGSKSIPKLIAFDELGNEIFTWGPRPKPAQRLFELWKGSKELDWDGFEMQLHKWYALDKGETIQEELFEKINLSTLNKDFSYSSN